MGPTFLIAAMAIGLAGLVRPGYELRASAAVVVLLALGLYVTATSVGL